MPIYIKHKVQLLLLSALAIVMGISQTMAQVYITGPISLSGYTKAPATVTAIGGSIKVSAGGNWELNGNITSADKTVANAPNPNGRAELITFDSTGYFTNTNNYIIDGYAAASRQAAPFLLPIGSGGTAYPVTVPAGSSVVAAYINGTGSTQSVMLPNNGTMVTTAYSPFIDLPLGISAGSYTFGYPAGFSNKPYSSLLSSGNTSAGGTTSSTAYSLLANVATFTATAGNATASLPLTSATQVYFSTSISLALPIIPAISYTGPNTYIMGAAITTLAPNSTGGAVTAYSISPSLPNGLSINATTGFISGTPTVLSPATYYTVTASNTGGSSTASIRITVNLLSPTINYTGPQVYVAGTAIAPLSPNSTGGAVASYSISPALTSGLVINGTSGTISGRPSVNAASTQYAITATNSGGSNVAKLTITVNPMLPAINYTGPLVYKVGVPIAPLLPNSTGGPVASYAISPAPPGGLAFDSATGILSGTPSTTALLASYTVTATNATGNSTANMSITVNMVPPGNALNFNNLVSVSTSSTAIAVSNNFTVEAWVRPTSTIGTMVLFSTRTGSDNSFDIQLIGGNNIHCDIGTGSSWLTTSADAAYNYKAGTWVHIAYTVSSTGYSIYANGNLINSGTFVGIPLLIDATHLINIGNNPSTGTTYFHGSIDEVRVYSSVLTQSNIQADMVNTAISVPASLVSYYNFDIAAGNVLYDQTNNGNNGTVNYIPHGGASGDWVESYAMVQPVAMPVTNLSYTGFTANWTAPQTGIVTNYLLDVSTSPVFANFVGNCNGLAVGGLSQTITGLALGTTYYYRVRADKTSVTGQGNYSKTTTTSTLALAIPAISYTGPKTYTQGKVITALIPTNAGGAIPATNYGQVSVLAGSGTSGYADGNGTAASFKYASGIVTDGLGNLYVADVGNNRIRKIVISTGAVTTFAGSGNQASIDGTGTGASFSNPARIVIGGGNMYVSDNSSNMIRQVVLSTGVVTTLAGSGIAGSTNATGTAASFNDPIGLALDGAGNLYVADYNNNAVRKIVVSTGVVSNYAVSGTGGLNGVNDIAMDNAGNLYVDNYFGSQVRVVAPSGIVSILAGSGFDGHIDGTGTNASFTRAQGMALDNAGNIYLVQQFDAMVRRVAIATGAVTTIAAYGQSASTGYNNPQGVAVDGSGNIYVANANNNNILSVPVTGYSISPGLPAGLAFDATTGTISGRPTVTQLATTYTITGYNTVGSSTTTLSIAVTSYITPGGVSGAALWVRADDGASTVGGSAKTGWANQSGTTNLSGTGTFNNNAANLANFNPAVSFDGATNGYTASNLLPNGVTGNDNFLVARESSYSVAGCAFVYGNYLSANRINCHLTWGDGLVYWDFASNVGNGRLASTPVPLNTFGLYGFHNDNTVLNGHFIAINGNVAASGTISPALTFNGATYPTFTIGNNGNNYNYYQGNIAEMVTFASALTTVQRQQVESYLGMKYGETLPYNYLASDGTTTTYNASTYPNNIAGIGRDDTTALNQKQSQSLNTIAKGNMIAMGLTAVTTSNALNTGTFAIDRSFNIWGDDGGSATTLTALPSPGFSGCAQRLTRLWKVQRTGTGTGAVQVIADLNSTVSLTGYAAADIQLVVDTDGDGNLATGTIITYPASSLVAGVATFNNINWDSDGSGTDVFAIVTNKASNSPVASVISTATAVLAYIGCTDAGGYLQFVDNASAPSIKYMAINPNGNTAYDFATVASTVSNNSPFIGHQVKTDGSQNTTALANRMWTVTDKGIGTYATNGGMTVRLYYDSADINAATSALDTKVTSGFASRWFKFEGTGHLANVAGILLAQTTRTITGATLLTPSAMGTESNGTSYVEFMGIKNFSTFGYMAARNGMVLPITLASFTATANNCTANMAWQTSTESNSSHFEVETGTDGVSFVSIAQVASKNSVTGAAYSYIYKNLVGGANYFRLRTVDKDGKYTYSQTLAVTATGNCTTGSITAFPNPAHNVLNVKGMARGNHIMLLDINGKQLTNLIAGGVEMAIDISIFAKGVYTLRVESANGNVSTLKVVKQ